MQIQEKVQGFVLKIRPLFTQQQQIVIFTHLNPDGDAVGAALGLALFLKSKGHQVTVVSPNAVPKNLRWLPGYELLMIYTEKQTKVLEKIEQATVFFHVDHNELPRLGDELSAIMAKNQRPKLIIDHHPQPANFATEMLSITTVSSAAELCALFVRQFEQKNITMTDVATCFYTGIMTDTGNFSFNSSQPETYRLVAELLEAGIDKDAISQAIYDNFSENRMRLMGLALSRKMVVKPEFQMAYISLTESEMGEFKFEDGDSEGFVNLPFSIQNIRLSVLFTEKKDYVKLSLRSRGQIDVNWLAREYYKGGGHRNAAGGKSHKSLNETIEEFNRLITKHQDKILNP